MTSQEARMQIRRWGIAALCGVALTSTALVACGDDDDDDTDINDVEGVTEETADGGDETATGGDETTTAEGGDEGGDTSGEIPAGAPTIVQEDIEFKPGELEVQEGETVYFTSEDAAIHTVTINGNNESGTMREGDVFEWEPPQTGEFDITCDFHPEMQATVTVS
jgi:plastocyanin